MNGADSGLQPQRTALAWSRTGLAVFVNALLALRTGAQLGMTFVVTLGIVLLFAAAGIVACGVWRQRYLAHSHAPIAPSVSMIRGVVITRWLACAAGLVSILVTLVPG
ncbi:MAG: DUF202 domain-containing protein [Rubrivivax sp.]|nr:DUF202 domain-containing protein [Rubrivivax sp.]